MGSDPGRSQHDALDALAYGINARKIKLDSRCRHIAVCGARLELAGLVFGSAGLGRSGVVGCSGGT
jgi:hypothetical protein